MTEAEHVFPAALLERLSGFVAAHLGLDFPPSRQKDLLRGIKSACRDLAAAGGDRDLIACAERLLASSALSREQMDILGAHLTIGETYFYRTVSFFSALEEVVIPRLLESADGEGRSLRFWSAGCSSGEEAYSLAIMLDRMGLLQDDLDRDGFPPILATDINPLSLAKAALGIYSEWSFRDTPPWLKENYFRPTGKGHFQIDERIRRAVRFAPLNLAQDPFPNSRNGTAGHDLILCRHVLMYFRRAAANQVVARLNRCLKEKGCLVVSPAEIAHLDLNGFRAERVRDTLVHWKRGKESDEAGERALIYKPDSVVFQPADRAMERPFGLPFSAHPAPLVPHSPKRPSPDSAPRPDFAPPVSAPARSSKNSDEILDRAGRLYSLGQYARAIEALGPVCGACAEADGREGELLDASVEQRLRACTLAAHASANLGKFEEALRWSGRVIEMDRMRPGAHYLIATILLELGRTAPAVEALRRVLYLDPGFAQAQLALARIAYLREEPDEAERLIRRALLSLAGRRPDEELAESDGLTVAALKQMAEAMLQHGSARKGRFQSFRFGDVR